MLNAGRCARSPTGRSSLWRPKVSWRCRDWEIRPLFQLEYGMPLRGEKNDKSKSVKVVPVAKAKDHETFCEAFSRAGLEPTTVERRIISQGKRGETPKKRVPGSNDK